MTTTASATTQGTQSNVSPGSSTGSAKRDEVVTVGVLSAVALLALVALVLFVTRRKKAAGASSSGDRDAFANPTYEFSNTPAVSHYEAEPAVFDGSNGGYLDVGGANEESDYVI